MFSISINVQAFKQDSPLQSKFKLSNNVRHFKQFQTLKVFKQPSNVHSSILSSNFQRLKQSFNQRLKQYLAFQTTFKLLMSLTNIYSTIHTSYKCPSFQTASKQSNLQTPFNVLNNIHRFKQSSTSLRNIYSTFHTGFKLSTFQTTFNGHKNFFENSNRRAVRNI